MTEREGGIKEIRNSLTFASIELLGLQMCEKCHERRYRHLSPPNCFGTEPICTSHIPSRNIGMISMLEPRVTRARQPGCFGGNIRWEGANKPHRYLENDAVGRELALQNPEECPLDHPG